MWRRLLVARWSRNTEPAKQEPQKQHHWVTFQWAVVVAAFAAVALWQVALFVAQDITLADVGTAFLLGLATLSRIVVLIAVASVFWVPVGVWVGTRPHVADLV